MLTNPLIQQLHDLHLTGMAAALAHQTRDTLDLSFDERLGLLIQHAQVPHVAAKISRADRWGGQ